MCVWGGGGGGGGGGASDKQSENTYDFNMSNY